jgi:outer membrane lipoprotein-sorting protein
MVRRGIALGIAISAIIIILFFAGCTRPAPAETIEELAERAAGITSVKYDEVMTEPANSGEPVETKVWIKGNKTRSEITAEGQTGVIIIDRDAQVGYMYFPAENMATKTDLSGEETTHMISTISLSATYWAQYVLASSETVVVGSETIDGKACLVVGSEDGEGKVWFWREYGFPIRAEFPDTDTLIEWKI